MKKINLVLVAAFLLLVASPAVAQDLAAGLKEALAIGTGNAVQLLSKANGYFGDAAVKILLPENMQKVADVLKKAGFQKEVDEFVLSMNRAAEQAAPKARPIFEDAVRKMTFDDAQKILKGKNTAATDYFKAKTSSPLTNVFKPVISESMNQTGATRSYKDLTDTATLRKKRWMACSLRSDRKKQKSARIRPPGRRTC